MTITKSMYNPETGSVCSSVYTQDGKPFCVVDNSYNTYAPAAIFFGILTTIRVFSNKGESAGKSEAFFKFIGLGYYAAEFASNYFYPDVEEMHNLNTTKDYSDIVENSQKREAFKTLSSIQAEFEAFQEKCKTEHGFRPSPPPALELLDKYSSEAIDMPTTNEVTPDFVGDLASTQEV